MRIAFASAGIGAVAGISLIATAAAAAIGGEFLLPPTMAGFTLGWSNPTGQMREYVPKGETVDRWTRMITVQQIGFRPGLTPEGFLGRWSAGFTRACPGAVVGAVASAPLGGHAGARVRIDCPRNPQTGLAETAIGRAIMGDEQLHMIQAAARRTFTTTDEHWAISVISGATMCAAAANDGRCGTGRGAVVGTVP